MTQNLQNAPFEGAGTTVIGNDHIGMVPIQSDSFGVQTEESVSVILYERSVAQCRGAQNMGRMPVYEHDDAVF